MRVLLDTHVLLAFLEGRKGRAGRWADLIHDPASQVHIGVVSSWEIALKMRIGKLEGDYAVVERSIAAAGLTELRIEHSHLLALAALPLVDGHRDPFDHLLMAQAIAEDLVFATDDRWAPRYPVRLLG